MTTQDTGERRAEDRPPERAADSRPAGAAANPSRRAEPPVEAGISHRERLASLGILAAGVGHEINNPLASMMACIQCLGRLLDTGMQRPEEIAEARELCELLEREVERCKQTTDNLMLIAQPWSSLPAELSFNRVVADTLALLRFQIRSQGIQVQESLQPDLPQMLARDSGMRSICMNLILNAVQAMPAGGRLWVTTSARGEMLEFMVQDTGPGIPADIRDRIWDPFFTTKPPGQGTGLGLPVTGSIVKRHAGSIQVENQPEGGARFTIRMPFRDDAPGSP